MVLKAGKSKQCGASSSEGPLAWRIVVGVHAAGCNHMARQKARDTEEGKALLFCCFVLFFFI